MEVLDPDVGAVTDKHAGGELVVALTGEEERRGAVVVDGVERGAVLEQRLQHVRRPAHSCRVVKRPAAKNKRMGDGRGCGRVANKKLDFFLQIGMSHMYMTVCVVTYEYVPKKEVTSVSLS